MTPPIDLTGLPTGTATFGGVPVVTVRLALADGRRLAVELVRPHVPDKLTAREQRIIATIRAAGKPLAPKVIAARMNVTSKGDFCTTLKNLTRRGFILRDAENMYTVPQPLTLEIDPCPPQPTN